MSSEGGYSTKVPAGWSQDSDTTSAGGDVLYRSTWTGPDGTKLLIDATPATAPAPPPNIMASESISHPAFGSARRYVFSGGALPQCSAGCLLYQMSDGKGGYAVLAGGGDPATAQAVAERAALELAD